MRSSTNTTTTYLLLAAAIIGFSGIPGRRQLAIVIGTQFPGSGRLYFVPHRHGYSGLHCIVPGWPWFRPGSLSNVPCRPGWAVLLAHSILRYPLFWRPDWGTDAGNIHCHRRAIIASLIYDQNGWLDYPELNYPGTGL